MIVLAVALFACLIFVAHLKVNPEIIGVNPTIVRLDEGFNLKIGQTAYLEKEKMKIKFVDISEDSRCLSNVQCFWAGQVKMVLNVDYQKNNSQKIDLILGAGTSNENSNFKVIEGYIIKLLNVEPYPNGAKIEKTDYTASLKLLKLL